MILALLVARYRLEGNSSVLSLCLPRSKRDLAQALLDRYGGSITNYPHKGGVRYRLSSKKSWRKVFLDAKAAWGRYGVESFRTLALIADEISARPIMTLRTAGKRMRQGANPLWSC